MASTEVVAEGGQAAGTSPDKPPPVESRVSALEEKLSGATRTAKALGVSVAVLFSVITYLGGRLIEADKQVKTLEVDLAAVRETAVKAIGAAGADAVAKVQAQTNTSIATVDERVGTAARTSIGALMAAEKEVQRRAYDAHTKWISQIYHEASANPERDWANGWWQRFVRDHKDEAFKDMSAARP